MELVIIQIKEQKNLLDAKMDIHFIVILFSCFLWQAVSFSNNNVDKCTLCEEGTYPKEEASECLK